MVASAGFEPAICASASAALIYRTLGQGSSGDGAYPTAGRCRNVYQFHHDASQ